MLGDRIRRFLRRIRSNRARPHAPETKRYLDSPYLLDPGRAWEMMREELARNGPRAQLSISLPTLGISFPAKPNHYYVDLGFHENMANFALEMDRLYGVEPRLEIPPEMMGQELLIGGGRTRNFGFTGPDGEDHIVWTTFYRRDPNTIVNLYLQGHEEVHVAVRVAGREVLAGLVPEIPALDGAWVLEADEELLAEVLGMQVVRCRGYGLDMLAEMLTWCEPLNRGSIEEALSLLGVGGRPESSVDGS